MWVRVDFLFGGVVGMVDDIFKGDILVGYDGWKQCVKGFDLRMCEGVVVVIVEFNVDGVGIDVGDVVLLFCSGVSGVYVFCDQLVDFVLGRNQVVGRDFELRIIELFKCCGGCFYGCVVYNNNVGSCVVFVGVEVW